MKNDRFEKAKQAVAEEHEEADWRMLIWNNGHKINEYYAEAAELYAQWVANEAVKEDRSKTRRMCLTVLPGLTPEMINNLWVFDGLAFENMPLPFPQQPDAI